MFFRKPKPLMHFKLKPICQNRTFLELTEYAFTRTDYVKCSKWFNLMTHSFAMKSLRVVIKSVLPVKERVSVALENNNLLQVVSVLLPV